jgi:hypothetical protein
MMIKESIPHKDIILQNLYASDNVSSTYMKPKLLEKKGRNTQITFGLFKLALTTPSPSKKTLSLNILSGNLENLSRSGSTLITTQASLSTLRKDRTQIRNPCPLHSMNSEVTHFSP